MSLILHIDSSTETAFVGLGKDGMLLSQLSNENQKDHAGFLHTAIQKIFEEQDCSITEVDAVAVTSGPGSYTGLRVGFAAAKGLCFALNRPLIAVGTLEMMAKAARDELETAVSAVLVPMIDARRMEVFTAVYNSSLESILPAQPMLLQPGSFSELLSSSVVYFFGSGAVKFRSICDHQNARFRDKINFFPALASLAFSRYLGKEFTDVVDSEPLYGKEFHSSFDKNNPGLI